MKKIRLTTTQFINKAITVHGTKYNYDLVKYIDNKSTVEVVCSIHGSFNQIAANHLQGNGCPKCRNEQRNKNKVLTTEKFIEKSNLVHDNKYDYTKSVYQKNNLCNVIITCPFHGDFVQKAIHHLIGKGCTPCGRNNISKAAKENSYGWSITSWKKKLENNKLAKPKLYVLKCYNNEEYFIKIGITINDIKIRYAGNREMPYNYDILFIYENDIEFIMQLEIASKKQLKSLKYIPKIHFNGNSECYLNKENEILNWVKDQII